MLLLNPRTVRFGAATWNDIVAVAIDRSPHRVALEWGDLGPHLTLADVPEQKVTIKVVQDVARDDINAPSPGEEGALSFFTAPASTGAGRKKVSATAVVTEVTHEVSLKVGARRTVTLVAISPDGAADPITITPAPSET